MVKLIQEEKFRVVAQLQYLLQVTENIEPIYKSAKIENLPSQDFVSNNVALQMLALEKQANTSV